MTVATVGVLLVGLAAGQAADPVVLKVGTVAPVGSPWHEALKDLGRRWEEASQGRVKLRIYAGGTQGSEGDMQRKLAIGQLQAVALSNVGLHDLVPEPQAFSVPLMFRDDGEVACAFRRMRARLDAAVQARGIVAVQWSRLGAAALFCNAPLATPAAVQGAKVFAWDGDPAAVSAWREAGFQPVVLPSTDLVPALTTRMVDCVGQLPLFMLTTRAFEKARYALDLPWSYVVGATVVKREAWEKIPPELRGTLLSIAEDVGARLDADARKLEADARGVMRREGLTLVPASPEAWRPVLERTWPVLRGEAVPAPFFDAVVAARDACRAQSGAAGR
jgi:TRAP-type C4-dicarboxylate transport system substrate-binding protein